MPRIKPEIVKARINRARQCLDKGVTYKLGRGGFNQKHINSVGWDDKKCDCSGFISYLSYLRRDQIHTQKPWAKWVPWVETTIIWKDATGKQFVFVKLDKAEPGCFVVYPDSFGRQGHIGLVTKENWKVITHDENWLPPIMRTTEITGIDCSMGSQRKYGYAIRERGLSFFLNNPKTIFVCLKEDLM